MQVKVDPQKDICSIETYLKTDVATVSLWDPQTSNICLIIDTGSDGNFKTIVNFGLELSQEHQKLVYKSEKGINISTKGDLYLGSSEWISTNPIEALEQNHVDVLNLPAGQYVVDVFSLLVKDDSGKPKNIQFAFCIFLVEKYNKSEGIELHSVTDPIILKYTG